MIIDTFVRSFVIQNGSASYICNIQIDSKVKMCFFNIKKMSRYQYQMMSKQFESR